MARVRWLAAAGLAGLTAIAAAGCRREKPPQDAGAGGSAAQTAPADADRTAAPPAAGASRMAAPLTVQVLDVGQGDAILVTNGTSRVLVDGGPSALRMGALLDSLGLNGGTIDVVVLTHPHLDHLGGLRELFRIRRNVRVRFFFENRDPSTGVALAALRDSVGARARRGELVIRDTDDPCADGRAVCTITLNGGARLHIMKPASRGDRPNDRSVPLKLVGPDSATFSMWLAGDAERDAMAWFDGTDYDVRPGMDVHVLKAGHHGSCNGVTRRELQLTTPAWVVASLAARNEYGHVHEQTKALWRAAGIPWYRTDQNGTVTIRASGAPGAGLTITPSRGGPSMDGPSDRRSNSC